MSVDQQPQNEGERSGLQSGDVVVDLPALGWSSSIGGACVAAMAATVVATWDTPWMWMCLGFALLAALMLGIGCGAFAHHLLGKTEQATQVIRAGRQALPVAIAAGLAGATLPTLSIAFVALLVGGVAAAIAALACGLCVGMLFACVAALA